MKSASDRANLVLLVTVVALVGVVGACKRGRNEGQGGHDRDVEVAHVATDKAPERCAECHLPEFEGASHPLHPSARPTTCAVCHTQTSWHGFRIEHPGFELTGAHARAAADRQLAGKERQVKCFWCHRGEPATYAKTSHACLACHEEDRDAAKHPDHATLSSACETCHSTEAWKPALRPIDEHDRDAGDATLVQDAGISDASPEASTSTKTVPKSKPVPTTKPVPTVKPVTRPTPVPDVTSRPSRHAGR